MQHYQTYNEHYANRCSINIYYSTERRCQIESSVSVCEYICKSYALLCFSFIFVILNCLLYYMTLAATDKYEKRAINSNSMTSCDRFHGSRMTQISRCVVVEK